MLLYTSSDNSRLQRRQLAVPFAVLSSLTAVAQSCCLQSLCSPLNVGEMVSVVSVAACWRWCCCSAAK